MTRRGVLAAIFGLWAGQAAAKRGPKATVLTFQPWWLKQPAIDAMVLRGQALYLRLWGRPA